MLNENDRQEVVARKMVDADLIFLVEIANKFGAWTGVTLFTKGIVITGLIISGKEYYEKVADSFGPKDENKVSVGDYFRNVSDSLYTNGDGADETEFPTNFMHLKDVKVSAGSGGLTPYNNAFLRVKIEEIDGHIIGSASN